MDCVAGKLLEDNNTAEELAEIIIKASSNLEDVFQIDFLKSGPTIVRKRTTPRSWAKITQGAWQEDDLATLAARGLLTIHTKSMQGWEVHPRPELLGAV